MKASPSPAPRVTPPASSPRAHAAARGHRREHLTITPRRRPLVLLPLEDLPTTDQPTAPSAAPPLDGRPPMLTEPLSLLGVASRQRERQSNPGPAAPVSQACGPGFDFTEVDGNRTRLAGIACDSRFEGGGAHQVPGHLRPRGYWHHVGPDVAGCTVSLRWPPPSCSAPTRSGTSTASRSWRSTRPSRWCGSSVTSTSRRSISTASRSPTSRPTCGRLV